MKLMRLTITVFLLCICLSPFILAQMVSGGDTLYGNEWISYDQEYLKIRVAEDGVYRITTEQLIDAGVPASQINASAFRLYWLGKERMLYSTKQDGSLGPGDYLEFFGQKNRSEVDRFLFSDPESQMLNPEYGLTSDSSTYFLTWSSNGAGIRYDPIANDLSGELPSKKLWYLHEEKLVLSEQHFKGEINGEGVRYSTYGEGEGFASKELTSRTFTLPASHQSGSGPAPVLQLKMTGNRLQHQVDLKWNNQNITEISFLGTNLIGGANLIDTSLILARSLQSSNKFTADTKAGGNDKVLFSVLNLIYPRLFRFDGQSSISLTIDDARDGVYLELEDFNHGGISPKVFDLSSGTISQGTIENGIVKIYLPSGPNRRQLSIVHPNSVLQFHLIQQVDFIDLSQSDAQFLIISNEDLYDDGQGRNWVSEYAQYRESELGGNYRTQIIEIQQLIDQFAYGVDMHPLSIKNFSNHAYKKWSNPQYLFLIGKGLEYGEARRHEESYEFLPVYGLPGSDNLLTSLGESSEPLIPVGRLAARTPQQISVYLDKVMIMEDQIVNAPQTIEDRGWMKRVLHLSAGAGASEKEVILNKMNDMAETISAAKFGAEITTVQFQASSDIIDGSVSEKTLDLINSGIALKSYFGHGGLSTTQFQGFEDPFFLNNTDRYPLMLALGCYTGNLFSRDISLGESNVLTPSKGGIAYIATSGLGFLSALDQFAKSWYRLWGIEQFGSTTGETLKAALGVHDDNDVISIKTLVQQLVLHGDPAFSMIPQDLTPDLLIDYSTMKTVPTSLDGQLDSFSIEFDVVNLGKVTQDSFNISIQHQLPSNKNIGLGSYRFVLNAGRKTFSIKLPLYKNENVLGTNVLKMEVDPLNEIVEMPDAAELNNELASRDGRKGYEFVIFDSALRPLIPPKFGITNNPDITLIASSTNPLGDPGRYQIEFDTTALFNSPILVSETLENQFAILKWKPPITLQDDIVYYWRVRTIDEDANQSWMESSFLFKQEIKNGWNQSHYFQFLEDDLRRLPLRQDRNFMFPLNFNDFNLKNKADRNEATGGNGFVNSQRWSDFFRWEVQEGIGFVMLDSSQAFGFQFNAQPGEFGSVNKTATRIASFPFPTNTPEQRKNIMDFVTNEIKDGTRVIAYTMQSSIDKTLSVQDWDGDTAQYETSLFDLFENQGANKIRLLLDSVRPYIFEFRKGSKPIKEIIAPSRSETADLFTQIPIINDEGILSSTTIGPARNWSSLNWEVTQVEESDSFKIVINKIVENNDEKMELGEFTESPIDLVSLLDDELSFISLDYVAKDGLGKSPPQLTQLRIEYDGLPDVTFNQGTLKVFDIDTLEIGTTSIVSRIGIENITTHPMDSLLIKYTISDQETSSNRTVRHTDLKPFQALVIQDTHALNFRGSIEFRVELNPDMDQDELYHFNNFLVKRIEAESDLTNPILDVTFDGQRIFNDDIVSPSPLIKISLDDDNENLLIEDTSTFRILLTDPDGITQLITPGSPDVTFIQASTQENIAYLEWQPTFVTDGVYELSVQGKDASGNRAGAIAYEIRFEVVLASSISSITNYPNPFTTSTRFLYTLTGSYIPQQYKITVYTPTGTVVKELTQIDLGPLRSGRNLTEGSWNATDEYGDRLANGTYLYTFRILDKEQEMEHRTTSLDNYIEKGYSKMVIIR